MRNALFGSLFVVAALSAVMIPANAHAVGEPTVSGRIWFDGDSTLHKFKAEATTIHTAFRIEAGAADLEAAIRQGAFKSLTLTVPVKKLTSGESGLDDNMWKAMKADQYPQIVFTLGSYDVTPGDSFTMKLRGVLTISGVQRPIDLDVQVRRTATGLHLSGSRTLNMSEYDIKPPMLMMGMIKVKDPVTVRFELDLK